jgi:hypothetical protein
MSAAAQGSKEGTLFGERNKIKQAEVMPRNNTESNFRYVGIASPDAGELRSNL